MHYLSTFWFICLCVTSGEPRELVASLKIEYLLKLFATLSEEVTTSSLRNTDLIWTPESHQPRQSSQHLCAEGMETECAQGIRAGMHHLQEAAAPVKCPDSVGFFGGASQASFPGLLLHSSWEERQVRNWQMKGMKLLQEVVESRKRATRWGKLEPGANVLQVIIWWSWLCLCLEELPSLQASVVAATS